MLSLSSSSTVFLVVIMCFCYCRRQPLMLLRLVGRGVEADGGGVVDVGGGWRSGCLGGAV